MTDVGRAHTAAIHERIGHNALVAPDAPAIRMGGAVLTYRELDRRADRLAARLLERTSPRSIVAIWMERSFEHIVAALAVLRAGSAYVLLEPTDPVDRIRTLVDGSAITLVLVDRDNGERLSDIHAEVMTVVDSDDVPITTRPPYVVGPDDLAYVAFTSGTTGRPKGAMISHANLDALVRWHTTAFSLERGDRASHVAGLSFDAAAWEIWPTLAAGACLVLVDDTTRTSPVALREWLLRERVTIAFVPTALASRMMTMPWPRDGALRAMLTGGEALRVRPRADLPFAVFNNYGVAECTVVSTSGPIAPAEPGVAEAAIPSIGRPLPGVVLEVLGDDRRPVRRGEEGEIWIGGEMVGRGYLGQPDLTAAVFVEDPIPGRRDGIMYRTGDRGRRLPNGEIRHCGRRDDQCKIRGVRIELEEVATCLRRHDGVAEAVVVVEQDATLGDQLVAYVVPASTAPMAHPRPDDLRAHLSRSLPFNYVPARFVTLAALPLTPNGKIDRTRLSDDQAEPARALIEPDGPTETRLLGIVQDVLGRIDVSADDNFFLLGGHSLLATQVVLRARDAFGIPLVLRDLFEAPTIRTLGELVDGRIAVRVAAMSAAEVDAMLADARL